MSSAAEVLVIILSIVLAIFLVLSIILIIYMIVLTHKIRKIAQATEDTVQSFNSIMDSLAKALSPRLMAAAIERVIKKIKLAKDKKEDE